MPRNAPKDRPAEPPKINGGGGGGLVAPCFTVHRSLLIGHLSHFQGKTGRLCKIFHFRRVIWGLEGSSRD